MRHLSSPWLNSGHQQFRLPIICMFRTTPYKETQVSTEKCILTLLLPVRSFKKHEPQIIDNVQQQSNPLGQNHQRHSALRAMRRMNSENFSGHQSATKNRTERRVCVCCGLYVLCPHGLTCLSTWSPAVVLFCKTVGPSEGRAMLEVSYWAWALGFMVRPNLLPVFYFPIYRCVRGVVPQHCPTACVSPHTEWYPSNCEPN